MGKAWSNFKDAHPKLACSFMLEPPSERHCPPKLCINSVDKSNLELGASIFGGAVGALVVEYFFGSKPDPNDPNKDCVVEVDRLSLVLFNWGIITAVGVVGLLVLMMVFFPSIELFGSLLGVVEFIAGYIQSGFYYFFWFWLQAYDLAKGFTESLMDGLGGNPFLFYALGTELVLYCFLFVVLGFWQAGQRFMSTPIYDVFHWLNTPFRLLRTMFFQKYFGVIAGNMLMLFFMPLEALLVLLSVPIGGVIWVVRGVRGEED